MENVALFAFKNSPLDGETTFMTDHAQSSILSVNANKTQKSIPSSTLGSNRLFLLRVPKKCHVLTPIMTDNHDIIL